MADAVHQRASQASALNREGRGAFHSRVTSIGRRKVTRRRGRARIRILAHARGEQALTSTTRSGHAPAAPRSGGCDQSYASLPVVEAVSAALQRPTAARVDIPSAAVVHRGLSERLVWRTARARRLSMGLLDVLEIIHRVSARSRGSGRGVTAWTAAETRADRRMANSLFVTHEGRVAPLAAPRKKRLQTVRT